MAIETTDQNKTSSHKEFESLLNDDFKDRKLKENEIIKATVTEITKNFIVVPYDLKLVAQSTQLVLKFTAPATVSQFIPPISAMLVTIIVASFGNFAVGAWGLANRIEYLSIILILAITMALPPMVGKLKGQGDYQEIFKLIKTAIQFIIVFQLILAISLIIIASPLATIFSKKSEVTLLLEQYLWFVPISMVPSACAWLVYRQPVPLGYQRPH